jgi:seryl-tRNA synthetase
MKQQGGMMVTAEKRQAMRELAGRLSYFGIESDAADAIVALANDVDKLLDDLHKAEEKIYTIWQSAEELQRERDEASTQLGEALLREAQLKRKLIEYTRAEDREI